MPAEPAPGQAAYEAAALAIMNANNANDDEPERFEAALMAKVALEAGVPELNAEIASLREQLDRERNALTLARAAAREMSDEFVTWTITPADRERITGWRRQAGLEGGG